MFPDSWRIQRSATNWPKILKGTPLNHHLKVRSLSPLGAFVLEGWSGHTATWTKAFKSERGETIPQIVAHRGYRAKFPENTMLAFKNAVTAGAHGVETDVHLTKDNVVVLSHVWDSPAQRHHDVVWLEKQGKTADFFFSNRILLLSVVLARIDWLQIVNGAISRILELSMSPTNLWLDWLIFWNI